MKKLKVIKKFNYALLLLSKKVVYDNINMKKKGDDKYERISKRKFGGKTNERTKRKHNETKNSTEKVKHLKKKLCKKTSS